MPEPGRSSERFSQKPHDASAYSREKRQWQVSARAPLIGAKSTGGDESLRGIDQTLHNGDQKPRRALLLEIIDFVESVGRLAHRNLVGEHQRTAAEFEHLAQRDQRAHSAIGAVRGGAERE